MSRIYTDDRPLFTAMSRNTYYACPPRKSFAVATRVTLASESVRPESVRESIV